VDLNIFTLFLNAGLVVKLVILLLLGFSVYSWYIVFEKYALFKRVKTESERFLDSFWKCRDLAEAQKAAETASTCPEAAIFRTGYRELKKLGKGKVDNGEATLEKRLAGMEPLKRAVAKTELLESSRLGRSLSFLATTGNTAPFVGLFGTVWGIMTSFHEIGLKGSASLAVVAPGVSEALVVTALGLAVAIPAVVFYNTFSNQLHDIESRMHSFSTDFLNLIERDFISRFDG